MLIDSQEVLRGIDAQRSTVGILPFKTAYKDGILAGLDMAEAYVKGIEENEGRRLANGRDASGEAGSVGSDAPGKEK